MADGKPAEPKRLNEDVDDVTENYYIKDKLEYTFTVKMIQMHHRQLHHMTVIFILI